MSTRTTHYVLAGFRMTYGDWKAIVDYLGRLRYPDASHDWDRRVEIFLQDMGLEVVADGMNCQYTFVGRVISRTEDSSGFVDGPIVDCLDYSWTIEDMRRKLAEFGVDGAFSVWSFFHSW